MGPRKAARSMYVLCLSIKEWTNEIQVKDHLPDCILQRNSLDCQTKNRDVRMPEERCFGQAVLADRLISAFSQKIGGDLPLSLPKKAHPSTARPKQYNARTSISMVESFQKNLPERLLIYSPWGSDE